MLVLLPPLVATFMMMMMSIASAQPRTLTEGELRQTSAGLLDTYVIVLSLINVNVKNDAVASSAGSGSALATAISNVLVNSNIHIDASDKLIMMPSLSDAKNASINPTPARPDTVSMPTWIPWSNELWPGKFN